MKKREIFVVVVNGPEHSGYIANCDPNDCWSNDNPSGWTYQDICGSHGNVWGEYETKEEASKVLEKYLECDSVEKGTYCYTHNPIKR